MARRKKDEPSNKDRLVSYLISKPEGGWELSEMADHIYSTITPGTLKMVSGLFSGARRSLQDYHRLLVIPKKYEGRKAVQWAFADGAPEDKDIVARYFQRAGRMQLGFEGSFGRVVTLVSEKHLLTEEVIQGLLKELQVPDPRTTKAA